MLKVGIRELKARLSEYLRKVRRGETLLVTDRGRIVAEIRSPAEAGGRTAGLAGLQVLIDRGIVSEGLPNDPSLYVRTGLRLPEGTGKRLLDEEREDKR
jgi:prevent-host-death family protein